jgi:ferredoxin
MSESLRVNPIVCEGHGLCAELFPERIQLDDWGYPIIDSDPIPRALAGHARRAVAACPVLALRLTKSNERVAASRSRGPSSERPAAPDYTFSTSSGQDRRRTAGRSHMHQSVKDSPA